MSNNLNNKYFEVVLKELNSLVESKSKGRESELAESVYSSLIMDNKSEVTGLTRNDKEAFFIEKIFKGLSEIIGTRDSLNNIEFYIRKFPYDPKKTSRIDFLKYHIHNYLNEVYILKERLTKYSTIVIRAYRKSDNAKDMKSVISEAGKSAATALEEIVGMRGGHVHDKRYSEESLDRLGMLEILSNSADEEETKRAYHYLYITGYRSERKGWVKRIRNSNIEIDKVIEKFTESFREQISPNEKIIYPSSSGWA